MRITDRTTVQINFFIKTIMVVLFVLGAFVFFADISKSSYSVTTAPVFNNTKGK